MKTIIINGVDCTRYFTPIGYSVGKNKVIGGNEGTMRDGSYQDDIVRWKTTLSLTCMPLTEAQFQTLMNTVYSNDTSVAIRFFDPNKGDYRTINFILPEPRTPKERGVGADGNTYWTGLSFEFEGVLE